MATNYLVEQLSPVQLPLVNKFYQQQRARSKAKGNERVYVTRRKLQIIAAARLADISACCFLTGVQVDNHYQRQGVAKTLLTAMLNDLTESCYTFPYQHLTGFYQQLGFVELAQQELPLPLQQRFVRYRGQGRDIVAMRFGD